MKIVGIGTMVGIGVFGIVSWGFVGNIVDMFNGSGIGMGVDGIITIISNTLIKTNNYPHAYTNTNTNTNTNTI